MRQPNFLSSFCSCLNLQWNFLENYINVQIFENSGMALNLIDSLIYLTHLLGGGQHCCSFWGIVFFTLCTLAEGKLLVLNTNSPSLFIAFLNHSQVLHKASRHQQCRCLILIGLLPGIANVNERFWLGHFFVQKTCSSLQSFFFWTKISKASKNEIFWQPFKCKGKFYDLLKTWGFWAKNTLFFFG